MKKFLTLLALVFVLSSCSVEAIPNEYKHQGTWELVRTRGNFAESERSGDELTFQETYIFKRNGKVTKTRIEPGALTSSISGTYKITIPADTETIEGHLLYLEITFPSKAPIVANCVNNAEEYLILTDDHQLVNSWVACDGLYMEYSKVE